MTAGTASDVLTSGDGLTCPAGLAVGSGWELFYAGTAPVRPQGGSSAQRQLRHQPAGGSVYLALAGGKVLAMDIGPGGPSSLYAAAGGTSAAII